MEGLRCRPSGTEKKEFYYSKPINQARGQKMSFEYSKLLNQARGRQNLNQGLGKGSRIHKAVSEGRGTGRGWAKLGLGSKQRSVRAKT